ncbi:MAG: hypothetical protein ACI4V1_09285 [Eubacteriales bacterium]
MEHALLKGAPMDAVGLQYHIFFRAEDEMKATAPYCNPSHLYNNRFRIVIGT